MNHERSYGIFGFLAGAAVGAALGILFAPRSGKETRERISDRMHGAKGDLDDIIEKGRERWSQAKGKASDAATMTKDEVNDFVHFLFEEGRDLKGRLRHEMADAAAKAKRTATENAGHSAN